jgi:hypothetical protein
LSEKRSIGGVFKGKQLLRGMQRTAIVTIPGGNKNTKDPKSDASDRSIDGCLLIYIIDVVERNDTNNLHQKRCNNGNSDFFTNSSRTSCSTKSICLPELLGCDSLK